MKKMAEIHSDTTAYFLADTPLFERISHYGRHLLWITAGGLLLLLILYRFSASNHAKAEADYLNAIHQLHRLQESTIASSDPIAAENALNELKVILSRRTELQPQYDGAIAQILIDNNHPQEAELFLQRAVKRTQEENAPFYKEYAQITLLISQKDYQTALDRSLKLQDGLNKVKSSLEPLQFGNTLVAFNLIRIATLRQELGQNETAKEAWLAAEKYAAAWEVPLLSSFNEGKISLKDYIKATLGR